MNNQAPAKYGSSFDFFRAGKLAECFQALAGRYDRTGTKLDALPRWDPGAPVRRLLIHAPPGIGIGAELLHFGFLATAAHELTDATIVIDDRLAPRLRRAFAPLKIVGRSSMSQTQESTLLAGIEQQTTLLSAGAICRQVTGGFARPRRFIGASRHDVHAFRQRFPPTKKLIGFAWKTTNAKWGLTRNVSIETLSSIAQCNSFIVTCLQHGCTDTELHELSQVGIIADRNFDSTIKFDELIDRVAAHDLIVTIDNTVAHVAGALNKRTILLPTEARSWVWDGPGALGFWYGAVKVLSAEELSGSSLMSIVTNALRGHPHG